MAFYTDGVVPWNSLDDNTRAPLSSEFEGGYPCGEADQQLFNWTAGWPIGNIWNMLLACGITPEAGKLLDLARAIQSGRVSYAVAGGTANALTATLAPVPTALAPGMSIRLLISAGNAAGGVTLNINGLGDVAVKGEDGSDLPAGALAPGMVELHYNHDGGYWQLSGFGSAAIRETIYREMQRFAIIADQKPAGTAGGTFTSGAWRTRDLNTIVTDPSGLVVAGDVSLAGNQVTLAAGTWLVEGSAPAGDVNGHKARLQNITDGTTAVSGTTENASDPPKADFIITRSSFVGQFTIAATKVFEVQHYGSFTTGVNGFGQGLSGAGNETYAMLKITKLGS